MSEAAFFNALVIGWFLIALLTFASLFFITAPYGRHARKGWGPRISSRAGWIVMETPAVLTITLFYLLGDRVGEPVPSIFLGLWLLHYVHRAWIYPFRRRGGVETMPLSIALMGVFFNGVNGYLQGRYLFTLSEPYALAWIGDPRFLIGTVVFLVGFAMNLHSDQILLNLRRPGETGYKIPRGGMYRFVTSPNYFGEIVEWFGWALLTWSISGVAFLAWTFANLAPRARAHHEWYRKTFPDYPKERKSLIPGIF